MKSQEKHFVPALLCLTLLTCSFALAGEVSGPIITGEVNHSVSRPMRELASPRTDAVARVVPPLITGLLSFAGQPNPGAQLYSDANGAVGATQYVQLVNNEYTVYDKTSGKVIAGPVEENALWSTFGGSCQTINSGEGTVTYDQLANVWILSHHAVPTGGPYLNCIAVSTTPDATGTYYLYGFELTQQFPDKPRIGVWPDAYYLSQDVLDATTHSFLRSQACALERDAMLAGEFAFTVCFQGSVSLPTFVVTTIDGQTPPPTGEPAFFWQLDQRPNVGKNNLNSFLFHVDWVTPANTTFTGPVPNVLPAYTDACNNFKPCIQQPNTGNLLQGWGDRLVGRVVYRNFGTYESVVMAHSISLHTNTIAHSAIRWYEYRTPQTPTLYQWGNVNPDANFRWVPAIAQDKYGDIAVGYNISSPTVYAGIRYSGRAFADHINSMEKEITLVNGAGAQIGNNHNWSSFTSLTLDPVDDCTFWYTAQYYATSSANGWKTQIASFRFPSCTN